MFGYWHLSKEVVSFQKMHLGLNCSICNIELTSENAYGRLDKRIKKCVNCSSHTYRHGETYVPFKGVRQPIGHFTRYGLTFNQYMDMRALQNDCCKICGLKSAWLNIDHCHKSGKVRGLLCHNCNVGLGNFKDNTTFMQNAIHYLQENYNWVQSFNHHFPESKSPAVTRS